MRCTKGLRWLCQNSKTLERFSGQWVMFSTDEGIVSNGESLQRVLKAAGRHKMKDRPFVFHVPSKEELNPPLTVFKK